MTSHHTPLAEEEMSPLSLARKKVENCHQSPLRARSKREFFVFDVLRAHFYVARARDNGDKS